MNPLSLLNPARWMLYLALAASVLGGYLYWQHHERSIGAAPYIAQLAAMKTEATKAQAKNLQIQQALEQNVKDAQNESLKRAEILQANADAALAQSHSLRDQLAAVRRELPGLTEAAVRRYADAASVVLAECTARYSAVAADADRRANAAQTLSDAWPK